MESLPNINLMLCGIAKT